MPESFFGRYNATSALHAGIEIHAAHPEALRPRNEFEFPHTPKSLRNSGAQTKSPATSKTSLPAFSESQFLPPAVIAPQIPPSLLPPPSTSADPANDEIC